MYVCICILVNMNLSDYCQVFFNLKVLDYVHDQNNSKYLDWAKRPRDTSILCCEWDFQYSVCITSQCEMSILTIPI